MKKLSPIELAQGQLDSYNRRDIEGFVKFYHGDVEVFEFPSQVAQFSGMEAFRARYEKLFLENPNLYCDLLSRMDVGSVVIDHEKVTGLVGRAELKAIAIYEIENHLIRKVTLIK